MKSRVPDPSYFEGWDSSFGGGLGFLTLGPGCSSGSRALFTVRKRVGTRVCCKPYFSVSSVSSVVDVFSDRSSGNKITSRMV